MRITRRDFMKYCAISAGALGLSTSGLMKIEKAMATEGGTQVVWLNGAACTGCTVSLANTATLSSIQDLLVDWPLAATEIAKVYFSTGSPTSGQIATIVDVLKNTLYVTDNAPAKGPLDLVFMETLSSAVGTRALDAAESVLGGLISTIPTPPKTTPFVLAIEGAIQTAENGKYCQVGGTAFMDEVKRYAMDVNCLAILAVGTCASFGGIPGAKGSVTGARGLISTGSISGGYQKTNTTGLWDYLRSTKTTTAEITGIAMSTFGAGYDPLSPPTVTVSTPTGGGTAATAHAVVTECGHVTFIVVDTPGSGYTSYETITVTVDAPVGNHPCDTDPDVQVVAEAILGVSEGPGLTTAEWNTLMGKTICIPGCPPHPDWIVGTIVYLLTYGEPPLMDKWHRPLDYYGSYQCTNCLWQTNEPASPDLTKGGVKQGNSPKLYKSKYNSQYEGCLGILGCKGRKTKADCSLRKWNSTTKGGDGTGWCVQTRGSCHGCTEPRFPDGWGKFFSYK